MITLKFNVLILPLYFAGVISGFAQKSAQGPVQPGFLTQNIRTVDSLVNDFMVKYHVPGLSFAIAKNDELKLQRCYGFSDMVSREVMTSTSRFRIASVSKPFTATAIMQLAERNKLHLHDKVFGNGALLGTTYGTYPYKKWVTEITVEVLLEHLAGGWGNDQNDPMFMHPEMNQARLISWAIDNQPLQYPPGTHYQYSNFGFCILGRIIEKVTGMKYDDYIRKNILLPCGISDMEIGGSTLAERKASEVYYYDTQEDPYTMNVRRMDSHGGWVATATDLVKFLVRVDKLPKKADLLKPATLDTMYSSPAVNPGYAKGWAVNKADNYWHNGSLPGEQAIAVCTHDGFCWAVLVNTRAGGDFGLDLDNLMWKIKFAVKRWPDQDLFTGSRLGN